MSPPTDNIPSPRKRADFPQVFRHERTLANRLRETSRYVGGRNACWCGSRACRLALHRMEEQFVSAIVCSFSGALAFSVVSNSGALKTPVDGISGTYRSQSAVSHSPAFLGTVHPSTAPLRPKAGKFFARSWGFPRWPATSIRLLSHPTSPLSRPSLAFDWNAAVPTPWSNPIFCGIGMVHNGFSRGYACFRANQPMTFDAVHPRPASAGGDRQRSSWRGRRTACGSQRTSYVCGSSDLPNGVALVPATAPEKEPEMDQGEILPTRRSPPLGLHRHTARPEGPGLADPVDGRGAGEDHSLREDPWRRQSLRSGVGTVPGSTDGLATDPNASRSQSDRILMEGTTGTMRGLRSTAANSRGRLPDPPSDLAHPRRSGHGRQLGVVACQLSSAGPRARRTDKSDRVLRGAFVKA